MFESFYGLTSNPFRMSADEQFRYAHRAYVKAWSYIKYALEQGEGFVLITGRPGTGKTTLIRDTLSEIDSDRIYAVNLVSNQLQGEELLRLVALEFGFEAQEFNKATLLTRIEQQALALHEEGRRVVVIVDEAQNLSANGLEELRLLSNLQTSNQPLFQIVLVGQEELRSLIYGRAMENITQRIVASCRLEPMQAQQVQGYIEHRLGLVGWEGDPEFDTNVFELLYRITHGVPREINLVMARLLLYGGLEKKHHLHRPDLLIVLKELVDERRLTFDQTLLVEELHATVSEGVSAEETTAGAGDGSETREATTAGVSAETVEVAVEDKPPKDDETVTDTRVPEQEALAAELPDASTEDRHPEDDAAVADTRVPEQEALAAEMPDASTGDQHPKDVGVFADILVPEQEAPATETSDTSTVETEEFVPIWNDRDESVQTKQRIGDDALLTGDEEVPDDLPPMPVMSDEDEHRPQGLLTDVGELLGEEQDSREGGGKRWRWFFYPVAVAVLLIALLIPKPDDISVLWHDVLQWATDLFGSAQVISQRDEQRAQTSSKEDSNSDSPADESSIPSQDNQGPPMQAQGTQASSPATKESDRSDTKSGSNLVKLPKDWGQGYWLLLDKMSGELTDESRATYAALVQRLKADTSLIVVLTGVSDNGMDPIKQLRDALKQAERTSDLLVNDGIDRQRLVVEGKAGAEAGHTSAVHVRLKSPVRVGSQD
ncbi:MAG: AAA family ATPase [Candidatus Thiodiazotropha sp.]